MPFINEKFEEYRADAEEEAVEAVEEFTEQLRTTAKEDRELIREVQMELSDGETETDDLIEEAVTSTLRWVGVY